MTYRRRILSFATQEAALEAAAKCRDACVRVITEAPIASPPYVAAQGVLEAIDAMAECVTGRRTHFHPKPHSTAPGMPDRDGTGIR